MRSITGWSMPDRVGGGRRGGDVLAGERRRSAGWRPSIFGVDVVAVGAGAGAAHREPEEVVDEVAVGGHLLHQRGREAELLAEQQRLVHRAHGHEAEGVLDQLELHARAHRAGVDRPHRDGVEARRDAGEGAVVGADGGEEVAGGRGVGATGDADVDEGEAGLRGELGQLGDVVGGDGRADAGDEARGGRPRRSPPGENSTSSSWARSSTTRNTTSTSAARAAAEGRARSASCGNDSNTAGCTSKAAPNRPAASSERAMPEPIIPRPTTPADTVGGVRHRRPPRPSRRAAWPRGS